MRCNQNFPKRYENVERVSAIQPQKSYPYCTKINCSGSPPSPGRFHTISVSFRNDELFTLIQSAESNRSNALRQQDRPRFGDGELRCPGLVSSSEVLMSDLADSSTERALQQSGESRSYRLAGEFHYSHLSLKQRSKRQLSAL
ncbi:hypothetical protein J6590_015552 [Homalodisca vitripennis]|nr:hypothetical protein J6590_015552 [Homalodisca vitripennis]